MTTLRDVHSRSRISGYDPDVLENGRVYVAGLGALGQNIVLDLALSGVGGLRLADPDEFEDHNATRSPFFPTAPDVARLGIGKAANVASRAKGISTANKPDYRFSKNLIQMIGDGPIRWADVIVSAVDSVSARAWLSERCKVHARPMIEGGFYADRFNWAIYDGERPTPCYRCSNPDRESSSSCRQYAQQAELQGVIPAIQAGAATLAGFMAHQTIEALHGRLPLAGRRFHCGLQGEVDAADLTLDPDCPGKHDELCDGGSVALGRDASLSGLLRVIEGLHGPCSVELAETFIERAACVKCREVCNVFAVEAAWLMNPHCDLCGGSWRRKSDSPSPYLAVKNCHSWQVANEELEQANCSAAGVGAGSSVIVTVDATNKQLLVRMAGDVNSQFTKIAEASPVIGLDLGKAG